MWAIGSWRILFKVLPWTALFCGAKLGLHRVGLEPWAFDALTGSLFGAATFVVSLVLGGTLGDFRTSEGLPGQIANSLETIEDGNRLVALSYGEKYEASSLRAQLGQVAAALEEGLLAGSGMEAVAIALDELNPGIARIEQVAGPGVANRIQMEQGKIRLWVTQIEGVRDTDFLGPAYVLLIIFLTGAVVTLLLLGADSFSENVTVSGFLFTSFLYLLLLIRDLDNPFQYDGKSSVDASLEPLSRVRSRFGGKEVPLVG
jgi:hypothetical protein